MGKTSYYSVNGHLLGESTSGAETTYMSDALGSTVGTITSTGMRNRYTYTPYGGQLSRTGADPDPKFLWNARSGYRASNRNNAECYVRRRHFSQVSKAWSSRDPVWPMEPPSAYGSSNPASSSDPTGMAVWFSPSCGGGGRMSDCCNILNNLMNGSVAADVTKCLSSLGFDPFLYWAAIATAFGNFGAFCAGATGSAGSGGGPGSGAAGKTVCVWCWGGTRADPAPPSGYPAPCSGVTCTSPLTGHTTLAETDMPTPGSPGESPSQSGNDSAIAPGCRPFKHNPPCEAALRAADPGIGRPACDASVSICPGYFNALWTASTSSTQNCTTLWHEFIHTIGITHGGPTDFVNAMECCLCRSLEQTLPPPTTSTRRCGFICDRFG